jgi:hypothetical protein
MDRETQMSAGVVPERFQQQTEELCRLLQSGDLERAAAQLPGMDSLLLEAVSRPLTELTTRISQLRAGDEVRLQVAFRTLKLTAEHTVRILQTIPAVAINGPHIRLHTDSIMSRLTTLRNLSGELQPLQSSLDILHQGDSRKKIDAAVQLETDLNRINSRLSNI